MRSPRTRLGALCSCLVLLTTLAACGGGDDEGPKQIVSTTPGVDAGTTDGGSGLDAGSSGGGEDAGRISSSGGNADGGGTSGSSSGGADSGGTSSGGTDTGGSSGGTDSSSGGSADSGGVICVNDNDCKALMPGVAACQVPRCINNQCQAGPGDDGTKCEDGTKCTTDDTCVGGVCKAGPFKCDDGNPCTEDSCDQATAVCKHKAVPSDLLTKCDDGDPCTAGDICDGSTCKGKPTDCDDANPCTDDKCDAKKGCQYSNNTKPCGDGDKCYAKGACKAGKCESGSKLTCEDGNPCTLYVCIASTGKC